jgi:hypothetical protein
VRRNQHTSVLLATVTGQPFTEETAGNTGNDITSDRVEINMLVA